MVEKKSEKDQDNSIHNEDQQMYCETHNEYVFWIENNGQFRQFHKNQTPGENDDFIYVMEYQSRGSTKSYKLKFI